MSALQASVSSAKSGPEDPSLMTPVAERLFQLKLLLDSLGRAPGCGCGASACSPVITKSGVAHSAC